MENHTLLNKGDIISSFSHNYHIKGLLGRGAYSNVYLAETKVTITDGLQPIEAEIKVAVKEYSINTDLCNAEKTEPCSITLVHSNNDHNVLEGAVRLGLYSLNHPHIIKIFDHFSYNSRNYTVYQYIKGCNLNEYIQKKGYLDEKESFEIAKQIGSAITYLHMVGYIHLDIKPSNIMLSEEGHATLIDLDTLTAANVPTSKQSTFKGTIGYSAPERAIADNAIQVLSDIYAFGGTLFKMLTGSTPIHANNDTFKEYIYTSLKEKNINEDLTKVVLKSMEFNESERYKTMDELLTELNRCSPKGHQENKEYLNQNFQEPRIINPEISDTDTAEIQI